MIATGVQITRFPFSHQIKLLFRENACYWPTADYTSGISLLQLVYSFSVKGEGLMGKKAFSCLVYLPLIKHCHCLAPVKQNQTVCSLFLRSCFVNTNRLKKRGNMQHVPA